MIITADRRADLPEGPSGRIDRVGAIGRHLGIMVHHESELEYAPQNLKRVCSIERSAGSSTGFNWVINRIQMSPIRSRLRQLQVDHFLG